MARIYKHKSRGWQLHYLLYYPEGHQVRKYRFYRTKEQAMYHLQEAERLEYQGIHAAYTRDDLLRYHRLDLINEAESRALGGPQGAPAPQLGELADMVLRKSVAENSIKSQESDRARVANVLAHFGPELRSDTITPDMLETFRQIRLKAVSPASVNKEFTKLTQMLDFAARMGSITDNPARTLRPLKDRRGRLPRALNEGEIGRLLDAAAANRQALGGLAYEMFMTYLYTGMRRSELINLKWQNVDLKRRRIAIQADLEPDGFTPKTRQARVVGVSTNLCEVLANLPHDGPYVFGGQQPIATISGVSHAFLRIRRAAGLPDDITLHSLRHSYISYLLEAGENPRRVQDLAGHSSYQTTQRYTHVLPSLNIAEDALDFGQTKRRTPKGTP